MSSNCGQEGTGLVSPGWIGGWGGEDPFSEYRCPVDGWGREWLGGPHVPLAVFGSMYRSLVEPDASFSNLDLEDGERGRGKEQAR